MNSLVDDLNEDENITNFKERNNMGIWENFETNDEFKKEVAAETAKSGDFDDLPFGQYEVALENIELKETKKEPARPMITTTFEVVGEDHEGRLIFVNQLVDTAQKMAIGLKFLNDLEPENKIEFDSPGQLAADVEKELKYIQNNAEFLLDYNENKKGFETYKIKEIFELTD